MGPLASGYEARPSYGEPQLQLQIIQEIPGLDAQSGRLSDVFIKVLDGIHRGVSVERVLLCPLTPHCQH
jgi:hypothetical protein